MVGEHMPNLFPQMNVTPKAHNLIWVMPRILKEFKSYFMFYKMEQAGEKIHSELNAIERQIWSIRNPQDRLWKYVERYELRNSLDLSIVKPVKKVWNEHLTRMEVPLPTELQSVQSWWWSGDARQPRLSVRGLLCVPVPIAFELFCSWTLVSMAWWSPRV